MAITSKGKQNQTKLNSDPGEPELLGETAPLS